MLDKNDKPHVTVKPGSRALGIPSETKIIGVAGDSDAERINFDVPRWYDGNDLGSKWWRVDVRNPLGQYDAVTPDVRVDEDEIHLEFTVRARHAVKDGAVTLRLRATDAEGFAWQSEDGDFVLKSSKIANTEPIPEPQITAIDQKMIEMEATRQTVSAAGAQALSCLLYTSITPVRTAFNTALENIKSFFSSAWNGIKGVWVAASGWFQDTVITPIENAFNTVAEAIKGVINGILGGVNWMIEKVEGGVNGIIGMINSIGFDIPAVVIAGQTIFEGASIRPNVSEVSFPRIPLLATGAVIPPNAQFAAVLGDQRYGRNLEAPESLIRQIVREESGGGDIVIRFEGSMAQFVRELRPVIERENRRVGTALVQGGSI